MDALIIIGYISLISYKREISHGVAAKNVWFSIFLTTMNVILVLPMGLQVIIKYPWCQIDIGDR